MGTTTMHVPTVELRDGVKIPQIGFGVFQVPPGEAATVVLEALNRGYRHVDTAASYRNEASVGQAIHASGLDRGDVFVTTKLWNDDHGYEQAHHALKDSIDRLELGYVDLYLIHWPVPAHDRYAETWRALIELAGQGAARAIGVSNFQPPHLDRVQAETGVVPAINQVELHPYFQQVGLRREHADRGILTEAWSPLGQGAVLEDPVIVALAEKHFRTPAQIVLRWHLQLGNVVIPKSVTPERMSENLDVLGFALDAADMESIAALDRGERLGPDPDDFVRGS